MAYSLYPRCQERISEALGNHLVHRVSQELLCHSTGLAGMIASKEYSRVKILYKYLCEDPKSV